MTGLSYGTISDQKMGISKNFTSLRFPANVGSGDVPAFIRFEPFETNYGTLKDYGSEFKNSGGSVFADGNSNNSIFSPNWNVNAGPLNINVKNPIGGIVGNLASKVENAIAKLTNGLITANISTIFGNSGSMISGRVDISGALSLSQKMQIDQSTKHGRGSINLFLPNELSSKLGIDYGSSSLGAGGAAAIQSIRDVQVKGATGEVVSDSIKNVLGNTLVEYTSKQEKLKTGLAVMEGLVANNYSYQIFNSVKFRNFSYSFKMVAKNDNEALEIKKICDMFIFYMLPNKLQSDAFSFFEVPPMWKIEYLYNYSPMKYHLQPKECFLQSADVKYGGESMNALHNDGSPLEVELKLDFIETEPLYRESKYVLDSTKGITGGPGTRAGQ